MTLLPVSKLHLTLLEAYLLIKNYYSAESFDSNRRENGTAISEHSHQENRFIKLSRRLQKVIARSRVTGTFPEDLRRSLKRGSRPAGLDKRVAEGLVRLCFTTSCPPRYFQGSKGTSRLVKPILGISGTPSGSFRHLRRSCRYLFTLATVLRASFTPFEKGTSRSFIVCCQPSPPSAADLPGPGPGPLGENLTAWRLRRRLFVLVAGDLTPGREN